MSRCSADGAMCAGRRAPLRHVATCVAWRNPLFYPSCGRSLRLTADNWSAAEAIRVKVQLRSIKSVKPYERNPRKNDPAVDAVALAEGVRLIDAMRERRWNA